MATTTATLEPGGPAPGAPGTARSAFDRSPALRMIGRRLLLAIPSVGGTTLLTFCLMNLLPGTAATALLGDSATPQEVALLNHKLGLDQPFLTRYLDWLGNALDGDLGASLAQRPVGHRPGLPAARGLRRADRARVPHRARRGRARGHPGGAQARRGRRLDQ